MGFLARRQGMGAAALLLAVSTVLSRCMGLVRDKVISWQFGAGGEADMYFAAFVVPDVINHLLAGGFLSITAIPLLARRFAEDEEDAWRLFSAMFHWMLLGSIALTLGAMLLAEPLAAVVAPGFDAARRARLAFFMRLVLPAQVFFLCGAVVTALLYLRRQFSVPALSPLIYNGCIILGGVLLPLVWPRAGMAGYCVGVTLGAALGAFCLPLAVASRGGIRWRAVWRHPLIRRFLLMTLPLMLGQTVIYLDEQFYRVFGSMAGDGAVSLLNYAKRITQVPIGLMGQAAAVASYPFLVALLAQKDEAGFSATLNTALKTSVGLILPCAAWMLVAALPIVSAIFQGGRFGPEESLAAAPLLRLMLAFTPFWIVHMVLARGYYAHGDTLTPAVTGTALAVCCLPIHAWWAVPRGPWAIALVSGGSVAAYVLWLAVIWIRRYGTAVFAGLPSLFLRALICALPAAGLAAICQSLAARFAEGLPPLAAACAAAAASGLAFAALFLPLARAFAPSIVAPLSRRFRPGVGA